jgi:hypothetical protein
LKRVDRDLHRRLLDQREDAQETGHSA